MAPKFATRDFFTFTDLRSRLDLFNEDGLGTLKLPGWVDALPELLHKVLEVEDPDTDKEIRRLVMRAIGNLVEIQELLDPTLLGKIATSMRIIGPIVQTAIKDTPISNDVIDFLRANNIVDRAFLDIDPSLAAVSNDASKSTETVPSTHHSNGIKDTHAAFNRENGGLVDNPVDDEQRGGEDDSVVVLIGIDGGREKTGESEANAGDKQAGGGIDEKGADHEELEVSNGAGTSMKPRLGSRRHRVPSQRLLDAQEVTSIAKSKKNAVEITNAKEGRSRCLQCQKQSITVCNSRSDWSGKNLSCENCDRSNTQCSQNSTTRNTRKHTSGAPKLTNSKAKKEALKKESGGVEDDNKGHAPTEPNGKVDVVFPQEYSHRRPPPIEMTEDSEMPPPHKKPRVDRSSPGREIPLPPLAPQPNPTRRATGTTIAPAVPIPLVSSFVQSPPAMAGVPPSTVTPPPSSTFTGSRNHVPRHVPPHCLDGVPSQSSLPDAPYTGTSVYLKELDARFRYYRRKIFFCVSRMRNAKSVFVSAKHKLNMVNEISQDTLNEIGEIDPDYSNLLAGFYPDTPLDLHHMIITKNHAPVDGQGKHLARS